MKKTISFLLSVIMLLSLTLTSCAAEETQVNNTTKIILQIGNPNMIVNGTEKPIDAEGTAPVIVNDRTLLPVRAVVEEMGGTVDWNGGTQTVTLNYGTDEINLVIDNTTAYLNGAAQTLDTAPTIINDRTMLPIRFIAESFMFEVDWDEATKTVAIEKNISENNTELNDNMVLIKGGTFTMGSPESEYERENDEVQHEVTVGDFYMSSTEVSQKEYQAIMGNNPSENAGENLPVENVTWYDAVNYCNALSRANGLDKVYTVDGDTVTWNKGASGYRLPTEAEWEYAVRANTETPFNFGDYVHNSDANCYNAYGYNNDASGNWVNGSDSYLRETVEVTRYNTNNFGLYNMHGNVAEWVWDWYGAYDTEVTDNPTGKDSGNAKVIRGGGWNDHPKHIRSAYRGAHPVDVPLYSVGFRVVRSRETGTGSLTSTFTKVNERENKNVLIAYFSQTGNTEGLTDIIADMTGADVFHIERKTPYASNSNGPVLYGEALDELREYAVPDLKTSLEEAGYNIDDYDTILLGYCNWWSSIPASVRSFLIKYDMSGKTIIPYCSMGGGRFGQTISAIAKLNPNSAIKEGLDVSYSSYDREEIRRWLEKNNISVKN